VLAGVFAAEYDEGVPGAGDPIRVALTIPNGATVRRGEWRIRRVCVRAIDGGARGWGVLNGREMVRMGII
jgi:hypothetical protein